MNRRRTRRGCGLSGLSTAVLLSLLLPAMSDAKRNLYTANSQGGEGGRIGALDVNAAGQLTAVAGSPFLTGSSPRSPAITPDGRYLYVPIYFGNNVAGYSVNPTTGVPASLAGGPYPAGNGPYGTAITPDGARLFVTNEGTPDTISRFAIGAGGSLTDLGTDTPTGAAPRGIAITPDGAYLYVANFGADNVTGFSIGAGGTLTAQPDSPFPAGTSPSVPVVTPDGKYLYVTNSGSGDVSGYSIGADGKLTELGGSPFPAGTTPLAGASITPDGRYLFVSNSGSGSVSRYSIGADGGLTTLGLPTGTGTNPTGTAVSPDGSRLYVANDDIPGSISAFTINAAGSLAPIAGAPSGGDFPEFQALVITPNQPPVANFVATPKTGGTVELDAAGSSDSDGSIPTYAWDFGDGSSATVSGLATSHTYASPGTYTARLTLTDNEGCSTGRVFTGRIVSCNGSGVATTSKQIVVGAAVDPPDPIAGKSVVVKTVSGKVFVKVPGSSAFVSLEQLESIPVGSVIDARDGKVALTSTRSGSKDQTARFKFGRFKVTQSRKPGARTILKLNGALVGCRGSGKRATSVDDPVLARKRGGRKLWGKGKGKFSSKGKRGSGSVRGTTWQVADRCDGSTVISSIKGRVVARDFVRNRKVTLKTGEGIIARPRRR